MDESSLYMAGLGIGLGIRYTGGLIAGLIVNHQDRKTEGSHTSFNALNKILPIMPVVGSLSEIVLTANADLVNIVGKQTIDYCVIVAGLYTSRLFEKLKR